MNPRPVSTLSRFVFREFCNGWADRAQAFDNGARSDQPLAFDQLLDELQQGLAPMLNDEERPQQP